VRDLLHAPLFPHKPVVEDATNDVRPNDGEDDDDCDTPARHGLRADAALSLTSSAGLPVEKVLTVALAREEARGVVVIRVADKVDVTRGTLVGARADVAICELHHHIAIVRWRSFVFCC